jgi:hypothetical protein
MIVYGDAQYVADADALVAQLKRQIEALRDSEYSLDALRTVLIQAGELEQAMADAPPEALPEGVLAWLASVTDAVAHAFESARQASAGSPVPHAHGPWRLRTQMLERLPELKAEVCVKIPEGFAHYALYPEQYAVAAERWAAQHAAQATEPVLVVGIRSIGTTLSAVVAAALRLKGRDVRRITVRPGGHPWERTAQFRPEDVGQPAWALVVDEGPGLSGSSMAAVAEALQAVGVDAARIVFFPGHAGEPGHAATPSTRAWWERVPRIVVSRDELRWYGHSLPEALAELVPPFYPGAAPVVTVEDLAGGPWRRIVYPDAEQWPAVCTAFERPKYRCVTGDGQAFLWKYHGLSSASHAAQQLADRSAEGWTQPPLGTAYGFVLTEWSEGVALTLEDRSAEFVVHLSRYLAAVAGPELTEAEDEAAWERLRELLYWNTWELLGEEAAASAAKWAERGTAHRARMPSYGDGRLSPEHWLCTPSGRWLKTSATGHEADHTAVGRQPLLWDVAGAWVEWELTPEESHPLLQAVPGTACNSELLTFYRMAYAAFRGGQCAMCADQSSGDPAEQDRLRRAATRYTGTLAGLLTGS